MDAITHVPSPVNEPTLDHAPGSTERAALEAELKAQQAQQLELTATIGGTKRMVAVRRRRWWPPMTTSTCSAY